MTLYAPVRSVVLLPEVEQNKRTPPRFLKLVPISTVAGSIIVPSTTSVTSEHPTHVIITPVNQDKKVILGVKRFLGVDKADIHTFSSPKITKRESGQSTSMECPDKEIAARAECSLGVDKLIKKEIQPIIMESGQSTSMECSDKEIAASSECSLGVDKLIKKEIQPIKMESGQARAEYSLGVDIQSIKIENGYSTSMECTDKEIAARAECSLGVDKASSPKLVKREIQSIKIENGHSTSMDYRDNEILDLQKKCVELEKSHSISNQRLIMRCIELEKKNLVLNQHLTMFHDLFRSKERLINFVKFLQIPSAK